MNPRPPGYEPGELPDCSTPRRFIQPSDWRAGNGTRTRDPNLGKVVLYQLSYSRAPPKSNRSVGGYLPPCQRLTGPTVPPSDRPTVRPSGGEGDRTPDLVNAIHALSQLSYAPYILPAPERLNRPAGTRHLIGALRRCQAISRLFHEHFCYLCVLKSTQIGRTDAAHS